MATVNDIQSSIRELSESDFREVMYWTVTTEKRRRESSAAVSEARLEMVREARIADPDVAPPVGEDWREPVSVLAAYLPGETAVHVDGEWMAVGHEPCMGEPGVDKEWVSTVPAEVGPTDGGEAPQDVPEVEIDMGDLPDPEGLQ